MATKNAINETSQSLTVTAGNIDAISAAAGSTRSLTVGNSDNTDAASMAIIKAYTGGASAGDGVFQASTTTTTWSLGVDNSVTSPTADPFVIAQGTALGTNDCMRITTSGAITKPLQPSFSVFLSGDILNVTGDGTVYTVIWDSEIFDIGSNFSTVTGKFTAPIDGKYWLYTDIYMYSLAAAHTACELHIVADRDYQPVKINPYATSVSGQLAINGGCFAYLTAGTEAYVSVRVSNSTKIVDLAGGANFYCFFYGYLVC